MPLPLPADIARHPDKQGTSEIPKLLVAYSADEINEQFGKGSNAYFRTFSGGSKAPRLYGRMFLEDEMEGRP